MEGTVQAEVQELEEDPQWIWELRSRGERPRNPTEQVQRVEPGRHQLPVHPEVRTRPHLKQSLR